MIILTIIGAAVSIGGWAAVASALTGRAKRRHEAETHALDYHRDLKAMQAELIQKSLEGSVLSANEARDIEHRILLRKAEAYGLLFKPPDDHEIPVTYEIYAPPQQRLLEPRRPRNVL